MKTANKSVAQLIWNDILQHSDSPFKWHFELSSVKAILNGTRFRVNAPFVVGLISITQNGEAKYDIAIKPDTFQSSLTFSGIESKDIVSTLNAVLLQGRLCENFKFGEIAEAV